MALQLDQTISDAAAKNRSFAESLESLIDCELQARNSRSIERRFRLSRLHARHSIDSFHFKHHKSRLELKPRILRLLDLEFIAKGTSAIFIGNPGVGKTFLAKIIGWRACQANQRVLFTTAMDMLNHLLASQVDHSLIRQLRLFTEPALLIVDELGYLSLDQQSSNLFYIRSSLLVTARSAPLSSPPIRRSQTGATSSTTPPSPPPSPIGWWRTRRSFSWAATASAKATGIPIRLRPNRPPATSKLRAVMITAPGSRPANPTTELP